MPRQAEALRTARLALRPWSPADVGALHALFGDAAVRRYLTDGEAMPRDWVESEVEASTARFAEEGQGLWALRRPGDEAVLGFAGFRPFHDPPERQLLYALAPAHWGQGLATEAARALVRCAFEVDGFEEIVAEADRPNEASLAVMQRLGMRPLRESEEGAFGGSRVYVLARATWRKGEEPWELVVRGEDALRPATSP